MNYYTKKRYKNNGQAVVTLPVIVFHWCWSLMPRLNVFGDVSQLLFLPIIRCSFPFPNISKLTLSNRFSYSSRMIILRGKNFVPDHRYKNTGSMYISLKDLQMLHHAFNIEFNVDQFKFRNHINKNYMKK